MLGRAVRLLATLMLSVIVVAAVAWAAQSRITKPMPAVTFRKPPPADK